MISDFFLIERFMIIEIDTRLNLATFNYTLHSTENQTSKNHTSEIIHQTSKNQTSKNHTSEIKHHKSNIRQNTFHPNCSLTTPHTITAIQTFVAGSAPHGNMSAGITGRCIALHAFSSGIHSIQSIEHLGSI